MKKCILSFKPVLLLFFLSFIFSCNSGNYDEKLLPFSSDPCELIAPTPDSLRYKAIYDMPTINL